MRVAFCTIILVLAISAPAHAQYVYEADGTANVGMVTTRQDTFLADPNADPEDIRTSIQTRFYSELRPAVAMQSQTARMLWRLGYQFAGTLALDADGSASYNNQAEAQAIMQPSKFTTMTVSASVSQGSQVFLLTSRPADAGTPDIRAATNPSLVAGSVAEALHTDVGRRTTLTHSVVGTFSAPQEAVDKYSASGTITLGLERVFPRDRIGFEARSTLSHLQPQNQELPQYFSTTNALVGRWNRDLSLRTTGLVTAGVEQVFTDFGAQPLAIVPTASAAAVYTFDKSSASIEANHGTVTNIQVGTVSVTDRVAVRGIYTLDATKRRLFSGSVGVLHNDPIGEAEGIVAAGTGWATQFDAGFVTEINKDFLFTTRFSVAYQFGQSSGIDSSLAQILLVGVSARYSNVDHLKTQRPRPARGRRVDGTDDMFPVVEETPLPE